MHIKNLLHARKHTNVSHVTARHLVGCGTWKFSCAVTCKINQAWNASPSPPSQPLPLLLIRSISLVPPRGSQSLSVSAVQRKRRLVEVYIWIAQQCGCDWQGDTSRAKGRVKWCARGSRSISWQFFYSVLSGGTDWQSNWNGWWFCWLLKLMLNVSRIVEFSISCNFKWYSGQWVELIKSTFWKYKNHFLCHSKIQCDLDPKIVYIPGQR